MLNKYRKWIMLFSDVLLVNLSLFLAFMIRFDWNLFTTIINSCFLFMFVVTLVRIPLFFLSGMYQWSFRYASISEALNVLKVITIGTLFIVAIAFFARCNEIGRSVLVIDYLICLFFVTGSRFLPRILIKLQQSRYTNLKRAIIVGAGSAGEMVARELLKADNKIYQPVGFVDDDPRKIKSRIHGIRVLGNTRSLPDIIRMYMCEEIIIAIPSASGKIIRDIISKCEHADVNIKTVPALHKILTGATTVQQIRNVEPEDLLGRECVEINKVDISSFLEDKVVLVTGASGTIGSELCRQIMRYNPRQLILYDHNENDTYFLELELQEAFNYIKFKTIIGDIKDIGLLKHTFSKYKPQIVFHSAAHKHVPLMEENPVAAVKNNIIGTRNFMYAAEHYGVGSFVMISSDKAVNPTSVMGASKRIAEMVIQTKSKRARTKFMAVRFGNVIGSSGSVVPIFRKQIEKGGPVTVTHPDVKRYFMVASEASQLVLQAGAIGKGGEIFVLDMGEQIKIVDLAKNLIILSGLELDDDIEIKFIGLRPGEKMHEEMLLDIEHDKTTKYEKIYISQPNDFDPRKLRSDVKELERYAHMMNEDKIVEKMKKMVPNFMLSEKGRFSQ